MRLELAPLRAGVGAEGGAPLASEVEIAPRLEADLPQLFGLAKGTFPDVVLVAGRARERGRARVGLPRSFRPT